MLFLTYTKLQPSDAISRTASSYPEEYILPSGETPKPDTRVVCPDPAASAYSEPENLRTRPSARPAMNVPESAVGTAAVIDFEGPYNVCIESALLYD